ncbi:PAS/PAC sensor signal transduction histidine kinase (fragment) [Burkholderiales bacterium]
MPHTSAELSPAALQQENALLEALVEQRTAELVHANKTLSTALQEFRLLVQQAPLPIAMLDRNMRYIATSQRWVSAFGRGHSHLEGLSHYDVHPDIPQEWIAVHRRSLAGEQVTKDEDLWVQADGTKVWLRWAVSPWRNEQGEVGGITIFTEDITQRKQAEELRLLRTEMELLANRQIAAQTVAAIAHDINQPLNSVSVYTGTALNMLRAGANQPEKLERVLQGAVKQAQRAGRTLQELLNFLQQGELTSEPVDLEAIVRDSLTIAADSSVFACQPVIDLEQDLRPVQANRLQLQKVLVNLLQNANQAIRDAGMTSGGIRITARTAAAGNCVQLTVHDDGPGLDRETAKHIFEPFFTTKPKGIGLGLAISRALVEAHGGQLWVDLEPGPGAKFHFTVPFAP